MSAITKFFGALINAVTGILGSVLGIFKKKNGEFFLEIDSSKEGATAPTAATVSKKADAKPPKKAKKAKKAKPPVKVEQPATPQGAPMPAASLINEAMNMPKPKVATIEPLDIPKFPAVRRPGANMQAFLDMAKTVKS